MQRCRQVVPDHFGFVQVSKCRVQLLETFEVVEYRFNYLINSLFTDIGRGDKGSAYTKGWRVSIGAFVRAAGNSGSSIVFVVVRQLLNRRTRNRSSKMR